MVYVVVSVIFSTNAKGSQIHARAHEMWMSNYNTLLQVLVLMRIALWIEQCKPAWAGGCTAEFFDWKNKIVNEGFNFNRNFYKQLVIGVRVVQFRRNHGWLHTDLHSIHNYYHYLAVSVKTSIFTNYTSHRLLPFIYSMFGFRKASRHQIVLKRVTTFLM